MVASANGHGMGADEKPYKRSQHWSDDPPPGTTVNISGSELSSSASETGSGRRSTGAASATSRRA
jgi:hypothetical protein